MSRELVPEVNLRVLAAEHWHLQHFSRLRMRVATFPIPHTSLVVL